MQFRLAHLLAMVGLIAVYLALRSWWVAVESERLAGLTPIVFSTICGLLLGALVDRYFVIFLSVAIVALLASTSFALECVFESPATDFMRRHRIQAQYSGDEDLQMFAILVITSVSTVIGGGTGSLVQFALRRVAFRRDT